MSYNFASESLERQHLISKRLGLGMFMRNKVHELLPPNSSVLDIGAGSGWHSLFFAEQGHKTTHNDLYHPGISHENLDFLIADIMTQGLYPMKRFDCVFASHVLEHQLNVNSFLKAVSHFVPEGGLIAICVPPAKASIASGHYTIWNAGLVLYNLVMVGLDCAQVKILRQGYNISVIIRKRTISLPPMEYGLGDLTKLRRFLPSEIEWDDDCFNGDITELNWG